MKLKKYFILSLLALTTAGFMSSCSDDENLGEAPRLFRPIASLEVSRNTIITTWDNIKDATSYDLELYKVTGTDDEGENIYELVKSATCEESPYTWSDLNWDEKYMVKIKGYNSSKASDVYTTSDVSVNYISNLSEIKLIDNAARLTWSTDGDIIKHITAVAENGEKLEFNVKESEFQQGFKDVYGLTPETKYTFYTYKSDEEFNNDTYAGKLTGTTKASTNFDESYGTGMWLDIRDYEPSEAKDTLKSEDFWAQVKDGMTIILRGEQEYKVNNTVKFDRSVTFVTGPTLGGNAIFLSSGGMTCTANAVIDKIKFESIDFISDKAYNGDNAIATNTDKAFGGRQVLNNNGTKSTIKELIFKNCKIEGYRAVVRAQNSNDAINKIMFNGCTINGVGDQGVVTTTNSAADWQDITFDDCTITNIVMLCDLRETKSAPTFTVKNCTFCYAPIETTANANTPLFRFGENPVKLEVQNSLFGPSMATDGSAGSKVHAYQAGTAGSILLNGASASVNVLQSFKTNFTYTEVGTNPKQYPIEGLNELSLDESKVWKDPTNGDFTIIGNIGVSGVGASKWAN